MKIEEYIEKVIEAFDLKGNEKKLAETREVISEHMDDIVKPAFEKGATPKECGQALFLAMLGAAFKGK